MQRQHAKGFPTLAIAESELITNAGLLRKGKGVNERVNHDIPHKMN
jgi:hypothetical protein